ncbi:MAG: hypothetical protein RLZZ165_867, partial [Bacteroidota bacterium]
SNGSTRYSSECRTTPSTGSKNSSHCKKTGPTYTGFSGWIHLWRRADRGIPPRPGHRGAQGPPRGLGGRHAPGGRRQCLHPEGRASPRMSYPAINSTELGCVTIVHCPLDEHKGMVAKVKEGSNKIQQLQVSLEKEIEKHKECRSTLVNSAVTGKIKVC